MTAETRFEEVTWWKGKRREKRERKWIVEFVGESSFDLDNFTKIAQVQKIIIH